jgi:hypothetical protein
MGFDQLEKRGQVLLILLGFQSQRQEDGYGVIDSSAVVSEILKNNTTRKSFESNS